MADNNPTTIKASTVNGGVAIDLRAAEVSYDIDLNVNTQQYPDRTAPGEVDEAGVGPFKLEVTVVIDRDDATANRVTFALLQQLAASRRVLKFYHDSFTNEAYNTPPFRQSDGTIHVRLLKIKCKDKTREKAIVRVKMTIIPTEEAYV